MPELIYETQDAVPEPFRPNAVEKDGKWAINVVPKAELDDFRNRNIEISRDRDAKTGLLGRLQTDAGFDPEKVDEFVTELTGLREIKQKVDDGKLVADTSLAEAVEAKTGEMKRGYEHQITTLTNTNNSLKGENEKLKGSLNRSIIDRELMTAINNPDSGALPVATKQILREAYDVFTIDEHGDLVAKDTKGNVIYGADGATPIQPMEWLKKLEETSPFFFKASQGGGAGGSGPTGGALSQAQLDAMSPEEKMNYGRRHNMNG